MPQRLTNGGVIIEGWLRLKGLMQVVLAVLRAELTAVAIVARDQPLAAWVVKGGGINIGGFDRAPERTPPWRRALVGIPQSVQAYGPLTALRRRGA